MQLFIKLVTRPHSDAWPRVLVTIIIVIIVAAAGWALYGPSGVIAVFAGGGVLAQLAPGQAGPLRPRAARESR
jgi:hypothetical protein